MLRLLLDAQTVQNFSLKLFSGLDGGAVVDGDVSRVPSIWGIVLGDADGSWIGDTEVPGGGRGTGGGGWGVAVRPWRRASRGSVDMMGGEGVIGCQLDIVRTGRIQGSADWPCKSCGV